MPLEIIALLFLAGLAAGFIDSIAGGGGLISVPALLWAGLPPQMALGTNKMQSSCGTAMAVHRYAKAGLVAWPEVRLAVLVTFLFALLGSWTLTRVGNDILKLVVPWLLLGAALYVLISPRLARHASRLRLGLISFSLLGGSVLGFYDGFFGPGTGAFWTIACLSLHGMELTRATAFTKVVNLTSNVASLLVFIAMARVDYGIAAAMIAGQLIGGRLGSGMAIRHGAPFIRVAFIAVVIAMVAKLLWDQLAGS